MSKRALDKADTDQAVDGDSTAHAKRLKTGQHLPSLSNNGSVESPAEIDDQVDDEIPNDIASAPMVVNDMYLETVRTPLPLNTFHANLW